MSIKPIPESWLTATRTGTPSSVPAAAVAPAADAPRDWSTGDEILGLYEVADVLGVGGMGVVHRVWHKQWGIDLAVKSPRAELLEALGHNRNFVEECDTWVRLGTHPHITVCFYVRVIGGVPRIFLEYVNGGSLQAAIRSRDLYRGDKAQSHARILDVAMQTAWGLEYTHGHDVVHKDVKPANVLLSRDGTAKITDFGLAKAVGGTIAYASPEQAALLAASRDRVAAVPPALTPATDIWSWGITVLEMFAGEPPCPYGGETAGHVLESFLGHGSGDDDIPPMPEALGELLRRCFRSDPAERPSTFAEVCGELEAIGANLRVRPDETKQKADALNNRGVSFLDLGRELDAMTAWSDALREAPWHLAATFNAHCLKWRNGTSTDQPLFDAVTRLQQRCAGDSAYQEVVAAVNRARGDRHPGERGTFSVRRHAIGDALCFSPSGAVLARLENGLALHDLESGRQSSVFAAQRAAIFSPDGSYVAVQTDDARIVLCDVATGAKLKEVRQRIDVQRFGPEIRDRPHELRDSVSFSPDSGAVAMIRQDGDVIVFSLPSLREEIPVTGHEKPVNSVRLHPDGRSLITGSDDGDVRISERASGKSVSLEKRGWPANVDISPNGEHVLIGAGDVYALVGIREGKKSPTFQSYRKRPHFSRRGTFVQASDGWVKRIYDVVSGAEVAPLAAEFCYAQELCGNEEFLLSSDGNTLCLRETRTGEPIRRFAPAPIRSIRISPDDRFAVTQEDRGTIVWDLVSGRALRTLHTTRLMEQPFSPDGRWLLAGEWLIALPDRQENDIDHYPMLSSVTAVMQTNEAAERVRQLVRDALAQISAGRFAEAYVALREAQAAPGYENDREIADELFRCATRAKWRPRAIRSVRLHAVFLDSPKEIELAPDGRTAAMWTKDHLSVRDVDSGYEVQRLEQIAIDALAPELVTRDNHLLVESNGQLAFLRLDDGRLSRLFDLQLERVRFAATAPDGRSLLACDGRNVVVCDTGSGKTVKLSGDGATITASCFSGDGGNVVTGGSDGLTRRFDSSTGAELCRYAGHRGPIAAVAISGDGSRLVTAGDDNSMRLWEVSTGRELARVEKWEPTHVQFSLDGRSLFWCAGSAVHLSTAELENPVFIGLSIGAQGSAFSPDSRFILAQEEIEREWFDVVVCDTATGAERLRLRGHRKKVTVARFSPDGSELLTAAYDGTVRRWDAATGAERECLTIRTPLQRVVPQPGVLLTGQSETKVPSACYSPDGRYSLLLAGHGVEIRDRWGPALRSGEFGGDVIAVAFSPDGAAFATGNERGAVELWDFARGMKLREYATEAVHDINPINWLSFLDEGRHIAWMDGHEVIIVCNAADGRELKRFNGRDLLKVRPPIGLSISVSRDGRRIAVGAMNAIAAGIFESRSRLDRLGWSSRRWRTVKRFRKHTKDVLLSPDGRSVLSRRSTADPLLIWDAATGVDIATIAPDISVRGTSFSADGAYVIAAGGARTSRDAVRLWDATSGREVACFDGDLGGLRVVAFSADLRYLIAACEDNVVRVWELDWERASIPLIIDSTRRGSRLKSAEAYGSTPAASTDDALSG